MQLTPPKESDTRNLVDRYKGLPNEEIKQDLAEHSFQYHIAIENYQHDFNIGTIVRNANAFNAAGVHIVGKRKWNRRGAMVTDKYLQLYHHESPDSLAEWAALNNLTILGIDNIAGSTPLHVSDIPKLGLFVFGQEGPGLSEEMKAHCKSIVAIEQFGSTRSVNVGVASGILLYTWLQRHVLSKPT